MTPIIEKNSTILFQGDSITDAGRMADGDAGLGRGYAMIAASAMMSKYATHNYKCINRGISGNRCVDLVGRWQEDCIDLNPDWVSIMIGINDTWRAFDSGDPTSIESYEESYRTILTRTRDEVGAKLILIDPFVLPYPDDRKEWRSDVDARIEVGHKLAEEYSAILIEMDAIMNQAAQERDPSYWTGDGVHPTPAGFGLMAQTWLDAVGA
jgi:acyl-CoA thioesterase-1